VTGDSHETVFCAHCRRPHRFERQPGLQSRECACGGMVSLLVWTEPTRWTMLEVDDK
jgi:hypothetical protein